MLLALFPRTMAGGAQALPIGAIPKKDGVSSMRGHVVDYRGHLIAPQLSAHRANWMRAQVLQPGHLPAVPVPARRGAGIGRAPAPARRQGSWAIGRGWRCSYSRGKGFNAWHARQCSAVQPVAPALATGRFNARTHEKIFSRGLALYPFLRI